MTADEPPGLSRVEEAVRAMIDRTFRPEGEALLPAVPRLAVFLSLVLEANARMNLVSRRFGTVDGLVERHLPDSLRGLAFLPAPGKRPWRLLDVGTGGGFPALPLLIARPDLHGVLFESTAKKARFLEEVAGRLSLTCRVVNDRFPSSTPMNEISPIDVLTTRAVADAGRLVRAARPNLAPAGRALLWTTRPLFDEAVRSSGLHRAIFHETPGTEQAGIAVLECST